MNKQSFRKRASQKNDNSEFSAKNTFLASIWGFLSFIAASALLIFLGTAISYSTNDPQKTEGLFGLLSLYAALFIGGFVTAKISGSSAFTSGIVFTALSVGSLFLAAAYQGGSSVGGAGIIILRLLSAAVPMLGSLVGSLKGKPRHKAPKFRKR